MRYLLDTNVVINYLNRRSLVLIDRFLATPTDDIVLLQGLAIEDWEGS